MNNQYNVLVDFIGALLIGAILIVERGKKRRGDPRTHMLLHRLMLCCMLVFLLDIPGLLLDGRTFAGARTLLWILDTAYWVFQIIYCWLWLLFADHWEFGSAERLKKRLPLYSLPMLAELLLIVSNPFTGWVFTLDAQNVYARGSLYLANMLPYVLYIAAALAVTIAGCRSNGDTERRRRGLLLLAFMFLPVCGVFFDAFVYGISWVWPMVALSLLMVYLNVQQHYISEERLAAAALKQEMADNRMSIMLSQIQPHFLYNALSSIASLCDIDPKTAKQATVAFSNFLRGNLASLTSETPITFDKELEHTRNYLSLEKLRFEDRLNIVYEINARLFRLPTLTLQPIVENAVHYGVTQREEGGTVIIRTKETAHAFVITVEDDGVGFDVDTPKADGRTHIGIQNVRERLKRMSGGTLLITSTPDVGTVAVITIPKEKQNGNIFN